MDKFANKLIQWLFATNALKVSRADSPFWYTSGTIGPYYVNTHFLYGSEDKANKLLKFINNSKDEIYTFPVEFTSVIWENYKSDAVYKGVIDQLCTFLKDTVSMDEIDYISGGERRDWFFSFLTAKILDKPHLTIYKDLSVNKYYNGRASVVNDIKGKKVLHIADLVTEASSYERSWIPAIQKIRGDMKWSIAVVDRNQGGKELLETLGVNLYSMVNIDKETFD
ncbi:MAG: orotate phosphoribosyltransferase, partial [Clostridiaceae bacterium]|nr:orotate phosphoribosyltransferase [Clostridiaceae bacterium]